MVLRFSACPDASWRPLRGSGDVRFHDDRQQHLHSAATSAYCLGYTHPGLYAETLAGVVGETSAVEPDEARETEDAVSRAEAELLALARWRELGAPITINERVGYREFRHTDPERAHAHCGDGAGPLGPFV